MVPKGDQIIYPSIPLLRIRSQFFLHPGICSKEVDLDWPRQFCFSLGKKHQTQRITKLSGDKKRQLGEFWLARWLDPDGWEMGIHSSEKAWRFGVRNLCKAMALPQSHSCDKCDARQAMFPECWVSFGSKKVTEFGSNFSYGVKKKFLLFVRWFRERASPLSIASIDWISFLGIPCHQSIPDCNVYWGGYFKNENSHFSHTSHFSDSMWEMQVFQTPLLHKSHLSLINSHISLVKSHISLLRWTAAFSDFIASHENAWRKKGLALHSEEGNICLHLP